ncbi:MOSC domain-containing protein [Deinococcus radiophilus]|uniref:MOSC domain-containing protein n=1 Tax=Deinococcus radiophilus TaxID=32062 RepID=A0A431VV74_9DEIO|nr:MOSC domain-containing protein [Deinococcus radiophilus]RTR27045.1 MOSC domain-containing protein [Deinococcus radiophilus]UFA50172.1 MOSC domain-containing protein [Deinococcus radiophilus]
MLTMHQLRAHLPRPGRLEWVGLRSARRAPVQSVPEAQIHPLVGLIGDHGKLTPPRLRALGTETSTEGTERPSSPVRAERGKRQVTLIQAEHLPVIAALAGVDMVTPELLRRNLLVSGISLLALKDRRFWVGEVLLEGTGECHPCSRMEENLGPGGYNAVRGHGGLTARVIQGGWVRVGDTVRPWEDA